MYIYIYCVCICFRFQVLNTSSKRFIFPFPAMSVYRSLVLIDAVSLMEFILLPLQAKLIKETRVLLAPLQRKIDSFSRNHGFFLSLSLPAFFVLGIPSANNHHTHHPYPSHSRCARKSQKIEHTLRSKVCAPKRSSGPLPQ